MVSTEVGLVDGIWRFPVKSMRGERIEQGECTGGSLIGDRSYGESKGSSFTIKSSQAHTPSGGSANCRPSEQEKPNV